jgi:hypothetical protein
MAIRYHQKSSHSITEFLESPFAGKHPKLIQKSTKAAAEASEVAAETERWCNKRLTRRLKNVRAVALCTSREPASRANI